MSLRTLTNAHFPNTHLGCLSLTAARGGGRVLLAASALLLFFARAVLCFGAEIRTGDGAVMALSLEQLLEVDVDKVYGASKYEQKLSQAPSSVSLVTRDEIQKQGYRTLADALRSVNGVYVTDDRNYSYVGMRGFNRPGDYNSRVLLLVDGHRINDSVYDQGLYGSEAFLDVDLIERVEVETPALMDYDVKSAFLVKFGMFVEWLTNALNAAKSSNFTIGILGDDPFGVRFDAAVKKETVCGRAVQLKRARKLAELADCQIVFISASESGRMAELLEALAGKGILTVADEPGFASRGGMIGFIKEAGKIRFEINPGAAEKAGLKLSSKLLQVGKRISEPGTAQG